MSSFISVKINNINFKHFVVPKEIFVYIKQLEAKINYPEFSKIEKLYPKRFKNIKKT